MSDDERTPTPARPADPGPAAGPTRRSVKERADRSAASDAGVRYAEEAPSPDVDVTHDSSSLPGAHRGGFSRLPTAPVAVTVESAPAEPGTEDEASGWTPAGTPEAHGRGLAGWALAFAVVGLGVALFVGWGFPIGLVAIISGIVALRRPLENRAVAVWALVLGTVSVLYSVGWLLWAGLQAGIIG